MTTFSERLFEDYCVDRGYAFKRIAISPGMGPTSEIICEVKQIEANEHDIASNADLVKHGQASSRVWGKRARAAIVSAARQLRRFHEDAIPLQMNLGIIGPSKT